MSMREAIARLAEGGTLTEDEAAAAMQELVEGAATPAQIGAFAMALRMKGETAEELAGLTRVMRGALIPVEVEDDVVDTAGTGGDSARTFNISTVAAIVAAGAGARVAKHGNRAASGACGSADLLEALDVVIDLPAADVVRLFGDHAGVREALQHVMEADIEFLSKLERWPEDPFNSLQAVHRLIFQRFSVMEPSDWKDHVVMGRRWTTRRVMRRLLEHELEHYGHIKEIMAALGADRPPE